MNPIKYDELIDKKVKTLTNEEKKEVFNFVEFIELKKVRSGDVFSSALKEGQALGKKMGVTKRDIEEEIKKVRKSR